MAEDIYHARMPVGPVGRPTERALIVNPMIFTHTKYPNAAKEYLRFMMEEEQYLPWLTASHRLLEPPAPGLRQGADLDRRPQAHALSARPVRRDLGRLQGQRRRGLGRGDRRLVVVQMVASVATGQATPEEAAAEAERRAKRYYRS